MENNRKGSQGLTLMQLNQFLFEYPQLSTKKNKINNKKNQNTNQQNRTQIQHVKQKFLTLNVQKEKGKAIETLNTKTTN